MKFSKRSIGNLAGIHPDLVRVMNEAIKDSSIDFTITEGVRTTERQQELYAQGRTKPGSIVTYADGVKSKSNHQVKADGYGHAVDLYPYIDGSVRMENVLPLKVIAGHIKSVAGALNINVQWGGDWEMKDYPHFEIIEK
ncbi:MAG: M15 family metallopeptidase [Tannerellaceae bacterium]|jgi:peptidoglycan L-alanyl-D-glutamate endopeptidase CwlK|nr:M15 family metallopeptidase [Tannerellaceae bacterium]